MIKHMTEPIVKFGHFLCGNRVVFMLTEILFARESYWREHGDLGQFPLLGPVKEELHKRSNHRMEKGRPGAHH